MQFYIFIAIKNSVSTSADLHSESVQELQHVPVYSLSNFCKFYSPHITNTTQLFRIKISHLSRPRQQLGPGAIAQPRSQITEICGPRRDKVGRKKSSLLTFFFEPITFESAFCRILNLSLNSSTSAMLFLLMVVTPTASISAPTLNTIWTDTGRCDGTW